VQTLPACHGAERVTAPVDVELDAVMRMAIARRPLLAAVGHGRDRRSAARAAAFAERWSARGGRLTGIVSWPATAASWLRPATRLSAGAPDLWVVADDPAGWAGMTARLVELGRWCPERTIAFGSLADPRLPDLCPRGGVDGLSGAAADGSQWTFDGDTLLRGASAAALIETAHASGRDHGTRRRQHGGVGGDRPPQSPQPWRGIDAQ
jgi:hypothetical protein